MTLQVLTIGHSTHSWDRFAHLLSEAGVTAIADVRTVPYSRHTPHFSRPELTQRLASRNIRYVFLGKELGGRPNDASFFATGVADYEKMASTDDFRNGLNRVVEGAGRFRICLMCSEQYPLDCHRCLLVGRRIHERGLKVLHILPDGRTETQTDIEEKLLEMAGIANADLFMPRDERLVQAYRERSSRVAFEEIESSPAQEAS